MSRLSEEYLKCDGFAKPNKELIVSEKTYNRYIEFETEMRQYVNIDLSVTLELFLKSLKDDIEENECDNWCDSYR